MPPPPPCRHRSHPAAPPPLPRRRAAAGLQCHGAPAACLSHRAASAAAPPAPPRCQRCHAKLSRQQLAHLRHDEVRFHLERLALARAARVMREGGAGREAMSVEDNAALVALNAWSR